jgi:peptide/nickel transport system permease protein
VCAMAPYLPLRDPITLDLSSRFLPPGSHGYPLGTDGFGRDLLSRTVWGVRLSLTVGLVAATVAAGVGSVVGLLSGYVGGHLDTIIMRIVDALLAFPSILLAIVVVAVLGPSLVNALLAVAVAGMPFYARMVRGAVLSVIEQDYILAAVSIGASGWRIMARSILPNVSSPILVTVSSHVGWIVVEAASLSFLGLGAQPPTAELGAMIAESGQYVSLAPHTVLVPGGMLMVVGVCFSLMGDAVRETLDPLALKVARYR